MAESKFLTAEEVSERYRGAVTVGTLENWRALRIGPPFVKIGKAVLYPIEELDAWDRQNMVVCRKSKVVGRSRITDD
ncbi:MAG TPA: DNA-binding protein [Sphingomonadaceae bacterium]|nr:DNA-binding protein [Sphingomonadaceae bacterium]